MIDQKYKIIVPILLVAFILNVLLAGYLYQKNSRLENDMFSQTDQVKTLTSQYTKEVNVLQNELQISKQNSQLLAQAVEKVQAGKSQPITYVTVQAPTVEQAASDIAGLIKDKDSTLPPAALEKSDRTAIVPQEVMQPDGKKEWQVGVYKVNNYRNWEWSMGFGTHGGDQYIPLEIQRNFDKNQAVSYEHHFAGKEKGWEVKYTLKTDKLFFLF